MKAAWVIACVAAIAISYTLSQQWMAVTQAALAGLVLGTIFGYSKR